MSASRMTLADELVEIRAEIARLKRREASLQRLADDMPPIPVFRRGWPILRKAGGTGSAAAAVTA